MSILIGSYRFKPSRFYAKREGVRVDNCLSFSLDVKQFFQDTDDKFVTVGVFTAVD